MPGERLSRRQIAPSPGWNHVRQPKSLWTGVPKPARACLWSCPDPDPKYPHKAGWQPVPFGTLPRQAQGHVVAHLLAAERRSGGGRMLFAGRRGGTVRFGILKGLSMAEQAKSVVVALKKSLTEKSSPPRRPSGCVCYCRSLSQPISNRFFRGGTRFEWFSTQPWGCSWGVS